MNTSESTFNYAYFDEYVRNQLQAVDLDIRKLKDEISQTLTTNKSNNREKRGAPLVAFGALTALTAGAGIASAVGSFLVVAEKQVEIVKKSTFLGKITKQ